MKKKVDTALYATIFPTESDPSQKRRIEIAEGAIRGYVSVGVEKTTFEVIAKNSGVSRPLIMHYFSEKEEIFDLAIRLIRANLQKMAVEAMQSADSPLARMEAYVQSVFDWAEEWENHAKVWMLYYYYSSIHSSHRKRHSELADMGHQRIEAMIREGIKAKQFKCRDPFTTAKTVQAMVTGGFVTYMSEEGRLPRGKIPKATINACLQLVGAGKD